MKENPFKRTFQLVQHTPLIHFQRGQAGATLRATEVKAKLDKFVLKHANSEEKHLLTKHLLDPGNHPDSGLDYKMKVTITRKGAAGTRCVPIPRNDKSYPMFFANMGNEYKDGDRQAILDEKLKIEIRSFKPALLSIIEKYVADFFASVNFGMRATKGYGSFSVENTSASKQPQFSFTVPTNDWRKAFQYVELFHKSVRGGINGAALPSGGFAKVGSIYMKPLIFLYANDQKVKWEKRIIKEKANNLFPLHQQRRDKSWETLDYDLPAQEGTWENVVDKAEKADWPLWQNKPKERIVRDLLGLSTDQSWRGYGPRVNREHRSEIKKAPTKAHEAIERFPSPFIFKPIKQGNQYLIQVFTVPIPQAYRDAEFEISVNGVNLDKAYAIWGEFDMNEFIKQYFKLSTLRSAIRIDTSIDGRASTIANILEDIYQQINPE